MDPQTSHLETEETVNEQIQCNPNTHLPGNERGRDSGQERGLKQKENAPRENGSDRWKQGDPYPTMPKNTTGGSKHKSQSNSESSKARNNRTLIDDLLDDYRTGANTDGVYVGRVLRRMGSGRMEVFYIRKQFNEFEGEHGEEVTQIVPMRGGLRGRGKKDVWVEPGSLVVLAGTGLAQTTHEIVAVFSATQVARLRKLKPDMNPRFFAEEPGMTKEDEGGIVIEDDSSEEPNVEDI